MNNTNDTTASEGSLGCRVGRLLSRALGLDERRWKWLQMERAQLEVLRANLEALRAWKEGNGVLQNKWTDECNRRLDEYFALSKEWERKYAPLDRATEPAVSQPPNQPNSASRCG